eukprot:15451144-Alexandrium_andersonii.AAC.1
MLAVPPRAPVGSVVVVAPARALPRPNAPRGVAAAAVGSAVAVAVAAAVAAAVVAAVAAAVAAVAVAARLRLLAPPPQNAAACEQ